MVDDTIELEFTLPEEETSPPEDASEQLIDEVAAEVLRGDWGKGRAREAALRQAGFDPKTVLTAARKLRDS